MDDNKSRVLIIDDNEVIRRLATTLLTKKDYQVSTAENGRLGIDEAQSFSPHVIMLDVMMPGMDGYECCKRLKNIDKTKDIPIIMVTSKTDSIDKIRALEIGAADYVTKPFDHGELQARVATQVKMKRLLDELEEKNKFLEELIKRDGLTTLYNHRYFHERISEEFNRCQRYKSPLSCILCDIDHFKNINDRYGHLAGDEILKSLAQIFMDTIREVDIPARYGGEEFALIIPHTALSEARNLAERIRESVENHVFTFNDHKIDVTISLGVSCIPVNKAATYTELIRFADEALYAAKENGRNRVEISKQ